MKIEKFEMERMQSTWENVVEMDMSESGVRPVSLRELGEMGLDLDELLGMPLGYSQSNGTVPLRESLAAVYPGATPEHIEVTNGTSEANYLLALALLRARRRSGVRGPQLHAVSAACRRASAHAFDAFRLRIDRDWEPDWEEFENAPSTRKDAPGLLSNPNNPIRLGALARSHAPHRGALRRGGRLSAGRRSLSGRGNPLRAHAQLLGHERPRHRDQRPLESVRHSRRAHRLDRGAERVVAECWTQHDYLTIGPNKISDTVARVAVRKSRASCTPARAPSCSTICRIMREWARGFGGFLTFREPQAGALCLVRYISAPPAISWRAHPRKAERADRAGRPSRSRRLFCASGWAASRSFYRKACAASELELRRNEPELRRELGLRDITLFAITCIVGTRWIPAAAHAGPGSVTLWVLGAVLFVVPLAIAVGALIVKYPGAGGFTVDARRFRALGGLSGLLAVLAGHRVLVPQRGDFLYAARRSIFWARASLPRREPHAAGRRFPWRRSGSRWARTWSA